MIWPVHLLLAFAVTTCQALAFGPSPQADLAATGTPEKSESDSAKVDIVKNVILITLDGLRCEEVFNGADQRLIIKENGVDKPDEISSQYWREDNESRRTALLPFLWEQIRTGRGWIAGDFEQNSKVTVTNGLYFSYPGYNEILTGRADARVISNDKIYNAGVTVLNG